MVDGGRPANRVAAGIGGLLGHDRRSPAEYYEAASAELAAYPSVTVRRGEIVDGTRDPGGRFGVTTGDGRRERARTVLTNGGGHLSDAQRDQLAAGGVALDERPVAALDGPGTRLRSVRFADGGTLPIEALLVKTYLSSARRWPGTSAPR